MHAASDQYTCSGVYESKQYCTKNSLWWSLSKVKCPATKIHLLEKWSDEKLGKKLKDGCSLTQWAYIFSCKYFSACAKPIITAYIFLALNNVVSSTLSASNVITRCHRRLPAGVFICVIAARVFSAIFLSTPFYFSHFICTTWFWCEWDHHC